MVHFLIYFYFKDLTLRSLSGDIFVHRFIQILSAWVRRSFPPFVCQLWDVDTNDSPALFLVLSVTKISVWRHYKRYIESFIDNVGNFLQKFPLRLQYFLGRFFLAFRGNIQICKISVGMSISFMTGNSQSQSFCHL